MKYNNKLRKLKRVDLLEMLLEQSREMERLKIELEQTKRQLHDRNIKIENAGSIAEAAMQLNDIFNVAQDTANQYLDNIKYMREASHSCAKRSLTETREKCANELANAYNKETIQTNETS